MNNKEINNAVENLQKQIEKGNDSQLHYDTWRTQSQSLIQQYFSSDSKEFIWFDRRVFADAHYGIDTAEYYRQERIKNIKNIQEHLKAAIDTVKIKGVYKPKKGNFLSTLSDTWLTFIIGLIISFTVFVFYVGRWTVQTENKSVPPSITPTFPVTDNKPSNQADSTYDSSKHKNQ